VDRIHVARFRDWWQAVVNTVMNFRIHKMQQIYWLVEELLSSREWLCSRQLVRIATTPSGPSLTRAILKQAYPISVSADGQSLLQRTPLHWPVALL
jgi:hypothetical protein